MKIIPAHLCHMRGFSAGSCTAVEDLIGYSRMRNMGSKHCPLPLDEHSVPVKCISVFKSVKTARYLNTIRDKASLDRANAFFFKFTDQFILTYLVSIKSDRYVCRLQKSLSYLESSLLSEILFENTVDLRFQRNPDAGLELLEISLCLRAFGEFPEDCIYIA